MLPTAQVTIIGAQNKEMKTVCLLDFCSSSNFITLKLAKHLNLQRKWKPIRVHGLAMSSDVITHSVYFRLKLPYHDPIKIEAFVAPDIAKFLPTIEKPQLTINESLLANKNFFNTSKVDILLGSSVLSELLIPQQVRDGKFILQSSKIGIIVMGGSGNVSENLVSYITNHQLCEGLERFFDSPLIEIDKDEEQDDEAAVRVYEKNLSRTSDGRYITAALFKENHEALGQTFTPVLRHFLRQELQYKNNPLLKHESRKFMNEFITENHMHEVKFEDIDPNIHHFIKYHTILRKDSLTSKVRNVFDLSSKGTNGKLSHNCIMHRGPKILNSINGIITKIRHFKYIWIADIKMMFRQLLMTDNDANYFHVFHRAKDDEEIKIFKITRIIYGAVSSPFIANQTLKRAALDNTDDEEVREIINKQAYVDDVMAGAATVAKCQQQIKKTVETLDKAKMPLMKITANHEDILKFVDPSRRRDTLITIEHEKEISKVLGLRLDLKKDEFFFEFKKPTNTKSTKRCIFSLVCSVYDILNWLMPVTLHLRLLMQKTWTLETDWDDPVEDELKDKFFNTLNELEKLNSIRIPRYFQCEEHGTNTIIMFSDASNVAVSAVMYIRHEINDIIHISLVTSKSKLVPLADQRKTRENNCTTPKLELEAVLLATELYTEMKPHLDPHSVIFYCDSTTVIHWIRHPAINTRKVIRRRVTAIRKIINPEDIHYVQSAENSSDLSSRGLTVDKFIEQQQFWFKGPSFLMNKILPRTEMNENVVQDVVLSTTIEPDWEYSFLNRYSSFQKMIRIVATMLKWRQQANRNELTIEDLEEAELRILRIEQSRVWSREMHHLAAHHELPPKHWMAKLSPFLHPIQRVIRVGGRLQHADEPYETKHPVILPKTGVITKIIHEIHHTNLHMPNRVIEIMIRKKYHVMNLTDAIAKIIQSCLRCRKFSRMYAQQIMAPLPPTRAQPTPPWTHIGLDYLGYFNCKVNEYNRFCRKICKVWICAFIDYSSHLCHFELVNDYGACEFLAALERFTSRRNMPQTINCDNQLAFHSTEKLLNMEWEELEKSCGDFIKVNRIKFRFNCPYSPHQGTMFENTVKSIKYYMKRNSIIEGMGIDSLRNLIIKGEACLNSRPMFLLNKDPTCWDVLTPHHFIGGKSLISLPHHKTEEIQSVPVKRRWQMVQELSATFWKHWSELHLVHLQKRNYWKRTQVNLKKDDCVIIRVTSCVPLCWPLGRVIDTFPDEDGIVRSVQLRLEDGKTTSRAIHNVIKILPMTDDTRMDEIIEGNFDEDGFLVEEDSNDINNTNNTNDFQEYVSGIANNYNQSFAAPFVNEEEPQPQQLDNYLVPPNSPIYLPAEEIESAEPSSSNHLSHSQQDFAYFSPTDPQEYINEFLPTDHTVDVNNQSPDAPRDTSPGLVQQSELNFQPETDEKTSEELLIDLNTSNTNNVSTFSGNSPTSEDEETEKREATILRLSALNQKALSPAKPRYKIPPFEKITTRSRAKKAANKHD